MNMKLFLMIMVAFGYRGHVAPSSAEREFAARVEVYRSDSTHIFDSVDYHLLGAENSTAKSWHQDQTDGQLCTCQQHRISKDVELSPSDALTAIQDEDGTIHAYLQVPYPEYQRSPEEIAWHWARVSALRALGVPEDRRMAMMDAERRKLFRAPKRLSYTRSEIGGAKIPNSNWHSIQNVDGGTLEQWDN
jgi:hypothetical protein